MRRIDKPSRLRRGSILPLLVILILVLFLTSMTAMQIGRDSSVRSLNIRADIAARYAADAGVSRALYLMNQALADGVWNTASLPSFSSEPLVGADAEYSVRVTGTLAGGYEIVSVGRSRNATRSVRAILEVTNPFALNFAVLTQNNIKLDGKTLVMGYNSSDPSQTNLKADIGTLSDANGTIDIKNDAVVNGNVYVGLNASPDDVVLLKSRSDVQGELFNQPPPLPDLVTVTPPSFFINRGKLSGKTVTLNSFNSGLYSSIDISTDGCLRVEDHCVLVVTGNIVLKNSAEIQIAPNASLTLYLQGNFVGDNSAGVRNETAVPSNFKLYGTGTDQKIVFKNSMDFHGAIYAPKADMAIYNGANVYGSLIVNSFELKNSGNVYYDIALRDVSIGDEGSIFRVVRWEEF